MELTGVDVRKKWVIKQKIRHKPFDKYLNPDFQDFNDVILKNMLQYNANSRISLEEIEIVLKNLIANENKEKKSDSQESQEETSQKSVKFIVEDSSPAKRHKSTHMKSFSISEEKQIDLKSQQQQQQLQQIKSQQLYQIQKSTPQSPTKRIIIPMDKIQQYNYTIRPTDSPDNSPLKKRSVKIITRSNKNSSQTPISGSGEPIFMSGASLTPNKQRIVSSNNIEQQEMQSKSLINQNRRAVSMHQNQYQEILPPINSQSRIQHMNNIAYSQIPSPISFMKKSFIQTNQNNSNSLVNSQIFPNTSSQSPINTNKKSSSKSFSQKIIIPKKLIPTNFQQNMMMMTKSQFDQQFLVSN